MTWNVYILECSDKSLYTGISRDLRKRILDHNAGKGAQYTRSRRPVRLRYHEKRDSKKQAEVREKEIKNLSKSNKERLIEFGLGKRVSLARSSS